MVHVNNDSTISDQLFALEVTDAVISHPFHLDYNTWVSEAHEGAMHIARGTPPVLPQEPHWLNSPGIEPKQEEVDEGEEELLITMMTMIAETNLNSVKSEQW